MGAIKTKLKEKMQGNKFSDWSKGSFEVQTGDRKEGKSDC
jgi:hypothetical protein